MTEVITSNSEKLLQALDSTEKQGCSTVLQLPQLPGPLRELNARTLQSVVTAITKDLGVDWSGDLPTWWPQDVPFCKPRTVPPNYRGKRLIKNSWRT